MQVVRTPGGDVIIDETGRAAGRRGLCLPDRRLPRQSDHQGAPSGRSRPRSRPICAMRWREPDRHDHTDRRRTPWPGVGVGPAAVAGRADRAPRRFVQRSGVQTLDPRERGADRAAGAIAGQGARRAARRQPGRHHPRADQERHLRDHQRADRPRHRVARGRRARLRGRRDRGDQRRRRRRGERPGGRGDQEILYEEDDPALLQPRAPIVTVMGHVDRGRRASSTRCGRPRWPPANAVGSRSTSARARSPTTASASSSSIPRSRGLHSDAARGAKVTDVAVVVVAADDGVMPQTLGPSAARKRPRSRSSSPSTRSTSPTPTRTGSRPS